MLKEKLEKSTEDQSRVETKRREALIELKSVEHRNQLMAKDL